MRSKTAVRRPHPNQGSSSGIIGHGHYVLRLRSAGISVCPRVAVSIPDRARVGHDPVIRSLIWSGAVPGVDLAGRLSSSVPRG
jgi:hypothetical protein